ncbi:hypothetical protein OHA25_61140 (plasmid) [Nonomuraea sp. NBC_00507]|uniref:hypothetical protein n=1 Tax=Nonomuraea sp. NBC_00507 TaxID=2976002 RepID=UPI002E184E40
MHESRTPRPTVDVHPSSPAADQPAGEDEEDSPAEGGPAGGSGAVLEPVAPPEKAPVSATGQPVPQQPSPEAAAHASTGASTPVEKLPWWWFVSFLIIFGMFSALVVVLVANGQPLPVALGVPGALSAAALGVLSWLRRLAHRRQA